MLSYITNNAQILFFFLPSTIAIAGLLWRIIKRYPSTIVMQLTKENQFIVNQCPSFNEYRPTPWIFNGHLMTVLGSTFRPLPSLSFERILLKVDSSGGTVAIDWHTRPYSNQPILLILHGLTGSSDNEYIRWMISYASTKLDLCCVVVHSHGSGRAKLTSPKPFCAANIDHVRASVKYIRFLVGNKTPIFAVGYSLGAGILTKYLGEEGDQCLLQGAIVCCASFNMHLSTSNLEQWLNVRLYNRHLTNNLLQYLQQHEEHFKKSDFGINLLDVYKCRTVREYDTHVVVPLYGFRDVHHFYTEASSDQWLKYIRIPTLILSAIDDPICPISGLEDKEVLQNSYLIAVKTLEGGHVSYLQGWWPISYSYDNIVVGDYIKARLKQINYQWEKRLNEQLRIDINITQELQTNFL